MTDEQAHDRHGHRGDLERHARSFGAVAAAYDRGRPSYPRDAAQWLVGGPARTVLELGAGTGKLTEHLVALGHDVIATDPDFDMLDLLSARAPGARVQQAPAEEIPLPDRSVDVVVAAQAFHWFDHDRALPEIARVLKPGGHLAVVWNGRDERIPWVRRLGDLLGRQDLDTSSADVLKSSGYFGFVEDRTFKQWQDVNRESILDMARSRSHIAVLDDEEREERLAAILAFYDDYGRGMDGMQLPYVVECFRAVVIDRPPAGIGDVDEPTDEGRRSDGDAAARGPIVSDGSDTDMLLIDFR
jgi:ubiquinone/menaquinone biosynthesis C-methylase UbiE